MAATLAILPAVCMEDYSDAIFMADVTVGQTFESNLFVTMVSGKMTVTASAATASSAFALGRAVDLPSGLLNSRLQSSNNALPGIPCIRLHAGMRFKMTLTGKALAATDVGTQYGLLLTANVHTVDGTNTTQKLFTIVEIPITPGILDGGIGDTNTRVIVEYINTVAALT